MIFNVHSNGYIITWILHHIIMHSNKKNLQQAKKPILSIHPLYLIPSPLGCPFISCEMKMADS